MRTFQYKLDKDSQKVVKSAIDALEGIARVHAKNGTVVEWALIVAAVSSVLGRATKILCETDKETALNLSESCFRNFCVGAGTHTHEQFEQMAADVEKLRQANAMVDGFEGSA